MHGVIADKLGVIKLMDKREVYFDNSATTRAFDEVRDIVAETMTVDYGNTSSRHMKGVEAERYVKAAREKIAKTLKVTEKEIVFTSGGTESNNLAIIGSAIANQRAGKHIITTAIEHASVAAVVGFLEEQGFEVTILPVDENGQISLEELEAAIREDTILVSMMQINNEMGAIEPVAEAGALIKKKNPNTLFHVDAIQSYGKLRIYPKKMNVDMLSVSGHKLHGPKGSGFLYIKENTKAIITTHASNVCGTIIPIEEIGALCKEKGLVYAVDTAQTAGILNIDMQKANIDFLAFTGHKGLLGPQGIGGFIASDKLEGLIDPVISGGTGSLSDSEEIPDFLPDRFESGTLNLPGIIGLHQALVYLKEAGIDNMRKEKMEITKYFLDQVKEIDGVKVAGKKTVEGRLGVVSIDFEGFDNSIVSFYLSSKYKIMTRVGMHCAPRAHKTLKTFPQGTVRFSFSHFNTKEEVDICIDAIKTILDDLRQGEELI